MGLEKEQRIDVAIHFQSTRTMHGHQEKEKYDLIGELMEKAGATYLRYEEILEEVDLVTTMIKLSHEKATIIRHGAITMRQELVEGKQTEGSYQTPYGRLAMTAKAQAVTFHWQKEEQTGELRLQYILTMAGQESTEQELLFTLRRYEEVE